MKKINHILPIIILILTFLNSCIGYHIGTGDKLNNLKNWQADRQAKKDAKKSERNNIVKY